MEKLRLEKETELLCSRARMGLLPLCWMRLEPVCFSSVLGAVHKHVLNSLSSHVFICLLQKYLLTEDHISCMVQCSWGLEMTWLDVVPASKKLTLYPVTSPLVNCIRFAAPVAFYWAWTFLFCKLYFTRSLRWPGLGASVASDKWSAGCPAYCGDPVGAIAGQPVSESVMAYMCAPCSGCRSAAEGHFLWLWWSVQTVIVNGIIVCFSVVSAKRQTNQS